MTSDCDDTGRPSHAPPHAYVPGQTPRHDDGLFAAIRASVRPGASPEALQHSAAWRVGLVWLDQGYFWEAHEVLEPVWMALTPGSPERTLVQAVIQLANAGVKARMGQPGAVRRIVAIARRLLAECGDGNEVVMGLRLTELEQRLQNIAAEPG